MSELLGMSRLLPIPLVLVVSFEFLLLLNIAKTFIKSILGQVILDL
jgi:hypothetical protein